MDRKTGKLIHNYIGGNKLKWYKKSRVKKERERKGEEKEMFYMKSFSPFFLITQTSVNSTFFSVVI